MPYAYLEDGVTSDVTLQAWGNDLDELFTAAANATVNVMVSRLESIAPAVTKTVAVDAEALDLLLLRFLEEIIFHKDADGLILRATDVHVTSRGGQHRVDARLCGEPIDPGTHELLADVKAVTLHGLCVERTGTGWRAQVTLDV